MVANTVDAIPNRYMRRVFVLVACVFVGGAFVVWSPWIYAWGMHEEGHARRRLYGMKWD